MLKACLLCPLNNICDFCPAKIGYYLYAESSEPRRLGDKAILVSGVFKGLQCMRFMYYMHGQDMGSLSVYRFGDGVMRTLFWRRRGEQGDRWNEARITFPCNAASYRVSLPFISFFPCLIVLVVVQTRRACFILFASLAFYPAQRVACGGCYN